MVRKVVAISIFTACFLMANDSATKLDTTVITTTGFESALKDEVRNVDVVTSDEIQGHGYKNLQELLEKVPSISFIDPGFGQTIDMRGQGNKSNTHVKVMLNGVSMNMLDTSHAIIPVNMIDIEDIDRVEIIPGGGSVLYGNGTSGGVINIITKTKPKKFYANVSSQIASYSYKDAGLSVGGMATNKLFLKLSAKAFDSKGYSYANRDRGFYTSGGLTYQINDNQSLVFTPSFYSTKTNSSGSLTRAQLDENRRQAPDPSDTTKDTKLDLVLDYGIKFTDNFDFHIVPYYQDIKMLNSSGGFTDKKIGSKFKGKYNYNSGTFIFGYDYLFNKGTRKSEYNFPGFEQYIFLNLKKKTHSLYFLEKHDFNDKFSLSAGYRFEKALYDISRYSKTSIQMGPHYTMNSVLSIHDYKKMNNYAFEVTPNFKYSDTGNVYLKFERGYISPSPTEFTDKIQVSPRRYEYKLNNLKPETFKTIEIGLKDLIFDQFFSATAFLTDTKDEITVDSVAHFRSWHFYNIDQTRRYGGEIYAEQYLLDKLKLSESYSYIDAKIVKGKNEGKKVPLVSKNKFVLGVDYEPVKNLNLLTDVKYYSSSYDFGYDTIPSRVIVDLGARYKFKTGLSLSAGIKNLFNKKYNLAQNYQADQYTPAPERNYYLELKYSY